jgi:N-methylhydantoinase A/oxoprolinase/acetone carboxylase beta subunit
MRAAADVGGTFTGVLLRLPTGEIAYHEVLSSPPSYDEAVADGVRNEKVGARSAREHYAVVLRADGSVDVDATTALRASRRSA